MHGEGSYILLKAFQQLCAPPGMRVTSGWQPSLNIRDFEHGGTTMSGLVSDVDIRAGKEILGFPTHTRENAKGWLPSWIRHRLVETGDAEKDYWSAWIHSLPKYEDYEGLGLPLTASPTELGKLRGLPKFGDVPAWTQDLQDSLRKELDFYNAHRGARPEISWKDALWGLMASFTRSFDCGGQGHITMAPVGDMVNHASAPNVVYYCERDMLKFTTRRPIKAGDELLVAYHPPKGGSVTLLSQYGILDKESDRGSWSQEDCQLLRDAHLEQSSNLYMKNAAKLIDINCPARAKGVDVLQAKVPFQVPAPCIQGFSRRRLRLHNFL